MASATRFDVEAGSHTAPLAAILLRSEAAASSQIEHLTASARKIAEAEATGAGSDHAELIVANARAMSLALAGTAEVTAASILEIHKALMVEHYPDMAGAWRTDNVWIGGRAAPFGAGSPHDATFVPPVAHRVSEAIEDLVAFINRNDLPALPQIALAHAQFETIHPFPDGNGRSGRALMHTMLRRRGVTRHISIPVSAGLMTDTSGYFDALSAYREGVTEPIIDCVAHALILGVERARDLVADLDAVWETWQERLTGLRSDSGARRLALGLLQRPVITSRLAQGLLTATNVHRRIDVLVERGILLPHQDYKSRNLTWRAPDVLAVLDAFANTGRRRRP